MRYRSLIPFLITSVAICSGAAHAQDAWVRGQVWGGLGVGYGSFGCLQAFRCDERDFGAAPSASSAFASVGGTVSRRVLAGFEASAWRKNDFASTNTLATASAVVWLRPFARAGFRFKGSLGLSSAWRRAIVGGDVEFRERETLGAASLGVVYDVPVAPKVFLSPGFAVGSSTPFGRFFDESRNMWQLVLGLTWR